MLETNYAWAFALAIVTGFGAPASAAVLWDNGGAPTEESYCDNNNNSCGGTGWTVADDFALTQASTVTGFTYYSRIDAGPAAYQSTFWTIWDQNPLTNFAGGPLASGMTSGTTSSYGNLTKIAVNGISVGLNAGTYWLGLTNNLTSGASAYGGSNNSRLGAATQYENSGSTTRTVSDAAFVVRGELGIAAVPEPSAWALMILGMGAIGGVMRRRGTTRLRLA